MLAVHCPRHHSRVLLTERHILGVDRSHEGLTVRWVCWCGYRGAHGTGRPRPVATGALS